MIIWRRLDVPGHDAARLIRFERGWRLEGTAVFAEAALPASLTYEVDCDAEWKTRSVRVRGWLGAAEVTRTIAADAGVWRLDEVEVTAVAGCIDIDLEFTPGTNLLPIRRLALSIGESVEVRAAWLRLPTLHLEPLTQRYHRLSETEYDYQSGSFRTRLTVDEQGFVTHYPPLWQKEN